MNADRIVLPARDRETVTSRSVGRPKSGQNVDQRRSANAAVVVTPARMLSTETSHRAQSTHEDGTAGMTSHDQGLSQNGNGRRRCEQRQRRRGASMNRAASSPPARPQASESVTRSPEDWPENDAR